MILQNLEQLRLGQAANIGGIQAQSGESGIGGGKDGEVTRAVEIPMDPISIEEMIACLKRVRKSVETWNKQGGRQGYLNYIENFIP